MSKRRIRYTIDLSSEAWLALIRHDYDPTLPPRGVSGPSGIVKGFLIGRIDGEFIDMPLRNRVCSLDGIEVDGHEGSDLDNGGECIHCGRDLFEFDGDDED